MRKLLFLLILLMVPANAYSQGTYDVSCSNVAWMEVIRIEANRWNVQSPNKYFHVLYLELKHEAAKELVALRKSQPTLHKVYRGDDYYPPDMIITANGKPLRNDIPAMTGFCIQGISIPIIREEDAFAAARQVCPALVPDKITIDGHYDKERTGQK